MLARSKTLGRLGLIVCTLSAWGCAQVLGIEETTLQQAEPEPEPLDDAGPEPEAEPPARGEDFRCLGEDWLEEAPSDRIEIIARIVEIDSSPTEPTFVEGMQVRVCRSRLDISCSGGEVTESDANGLVRVEVDKGFSGYLRIEGPDASGTERVGYLWYFSQPLVNTYVFPILAMTPQFRQDVIYGGVLGSDIEWDPTRGEIAINVTDCSPPEPLTQDVDGEEVANAPGVNAPGVHFAITEGNAIDERTRQFYFSNGNPVWPENEAAQVTDAAGLGGFLNVPPGPIPIEALPESLDRASGTDTLLVRENFLTTVRLLPE